MGRIRFGRGLLSRLGICIGRAKWTVQYQLVSTSTLGISEKNTVLHYAAMTNQETMMLMLIRSGCAMNPQNQAGNKPLHFATSNGSESVIAMLLRNGAKPDIANQEGRLPYNENDLGIKPSIRRLFSHSRSMIASRRSSAVSSQSTSPGVLLSILLTT